MSACPQKIGDPKRFKEEPFGIAITYTGRGPELGE